MTRSENKTQNSLIDAAWQQVERVEASTVAAHDTQRIHEAMQSLNAPAIGELPGYVIEHELHRGGQGVVYRAVQRSTNRPVAIKVMLGGQFAADQQTARFQREVRILGQLRHPNIVTIHDSGVENGVAYFVMDYIDGRTLGAYFAEDSIRLQDKLSLFTRVCDAVHAAHLHGVIHRDLKPNNILVDQQGNPHILDFGLAKPMGASEGFASEVATDVAMTETGQFLGSLPWASPEQAQGQAKLLDLRTDIYSLGVMLYQILTGDFPYPVTGALSDVVSAIVNAEPRVVDPDIDSDLATVALTALQKEASRRYQSAGAMKLDIERALAGEPIEARRASLWYLLRRRIVRHRWLSLVSTLLMASVLIGSIASTALWRMAARRAAESSAQAQKATAVTEFLAEMIQSANPVEGGAAGTTVEQAIDNAAMRLDNDALAEQPETEGQLRSIIGRTYGSLGKISKGREQLERAREIMLRESPRETRESLELLADIGGAYRRQRQLPKAESTLQEALSSVRALLGNDDPLVPRIMLGQAGIASDRKQLDVAEKLLRDAIAIASGHEEMAETHAYLLNDLALVLDHLQRHEEALEIQLQAVSESKRILGDHSFRAATSISNLAGLYSQLEQHQSAEEYYLQSLQQFRTLGGPQHPRVAECLNSMGEMYRKAGQLQKALEVLKEALAIRQEILPKKDVAIAGSLNNVAVMLFELGRLDEAQQYMAEAMQVMESILGPAHPNVGAMIGNIAGIDMRKGNYEAAIVGLRKAMNISSDHWGEDHINTAAAKHNLGQALVAGGQAEEGEVWLRAAWEERTQHFGPEHLLVAASADSLGGALQALGKLDEAEKFYRDALAVREQSNPKSTSTATSYHNLAGIREAQGNYEEALAHSEKAVAVIAETLPPEHWQVAWHRARYGTISAKLGDAAAIELLVDCREKLASALGKDHPHVTTVDRALGELKANP